MTNLGPVTTRTGIIFAANFYPIEGGLAGVPADELLFARQNFLCPAVGLSYPDMRLC